MPEKALRLYPPPTEPIEPAEIHHDNHTILQDSPRNPDRPYVISNMVASVDGKTTFGKKASGIGSGLDRIVMRNLRSRVDAVMVGAGTLRTERLSLGLDGSPRGRSQPLAVILTAGGDVPIRDNLVAHEGQDVLVITTEAKAGALAGPKDGPEEVLGVPEAPDGYPDLTRAMRTLKRERGVGRLLVEGGPTLNRALTSRGLLDELFLTVAPKLLGGDHNVARTIIEGGLPAPAALRLMSIHLAADELFLRYSLTAPDDQERGRNPQP